MKKEVKKQTEKEVKTKKSVSKKTKVEKNTKKDEKKKKGNIFSNIGRYFRGVLKEIKRIKWTSGKELVKYSVAAIAFVIFFGIYFYGIDWIVLLIRKLAN